MRKVVDLAFEKNLANLMRANAVDFKKCVGVVDFVEPELGPVRFKPGVDGPPRENWQSRSLASHSQVPCLLVVSNTLSGTSRRASHQSQGKVFAM